MDALTLFERSELYRREYLKALEERPRQSGLPYRLFYLARKELHDMGIEIEDLPQIKPILTTNETVQTHLTRFNQEI